MNQIFTIKYRIGDAVFDFKVTARDFHEAEAMLISIKETGEISGQVCRSCVDPDVAYESIREGDSLQEH